ncbi:hypothetical protein BUALT_Bualt06G0121600 [Buddleja alternifolia]|uniref:BHLH domain-containing protein n=1 Tax=Buddleja alternifolia TaxID=168488 RepID=A0AAV6XEJ2_9LAMI|nr:hypothetical protein BUALT_Bualt06G0121600 [Buddleja alternifolia]
MFPLQGNDLVIEDPLSSEQDKIFEDLADCAILDDGIDLTTEKSTVKKRRRKTASSASGNQENKNESSNDMKKTIHREIERQRRKEMSGLYTSLRSLLPLEYVKGKRSVSDHMHQAVNYIKHVQNNIEELQKKRDRLKKLSNPSSSNIDAEDQNLTINDPLNCVNVNLCLDGVEILIHSSLNEEAGFPLSKVLLDLIERGHNVISCVSTRAKEQSLHKIQIEVQLCF